MTQKDSIFKPFITGIRGCACICIMLDHYLGIYKYAQSFSRIPVLDAVLASPCAFLLNETFWLYLFCVISGYLAADRCCSLREVIFRSLHRLGKFAVHILFSYIVIYIICITAGFHNAEMSDLFQCDWFAYFYGDTYTLRDVLTGPYDVLVRGYAKLNNPYWMLGDLYWSSVLIYVLCWMGRQVSDRSYRPGRLPAAAAAVWLCFRVSAVAGACVTGMFACMCEKDCQQDRRCIPYALSAAACLLFLLPESRVSLLFGLLLILIPRWKITERLFSTRTAVSLGRLSWGIYSFHWPLICSAGALIMRYSAVSFSLVHAYLLTFLLIVILTVLLTVFYERTLGRTAVKAEEVFSNMLHRILQI